MKSNVSFPDIKTLQSKKQKNSKRLTEITNLVENELKNYPSYKNIDDRVMKGILQKKKENEKFMSGYKKKYFVLTHKALMYSDKEMSSNSTIGKFLMFCDYDGIKHVSEEEVKKKFCIRLFSHRDPKQSILLAASDELEETLWFYQIRDKMYINSSYFTKEEEDIEEDIQDESEQYKNLTNDELNELVRLINVEEKVKTNFVKYIFISKMDEIVKKLSNNENQEYNIGDKLEEDEKKTVLKLEKLRNDNMDLFLSITTDRKQEDFMLFLV
ncbi:hypothetical protein BCR36DRAFT_295772 [Piromyces finnis]|uniref:PH domain-containing protein n=1 Tax=Piromyces finnis TaxID=1754191 RepID=A0A1Y1V4W2_9FUNG|nr:hypothetical protein BCR36DRAFT_295772 [Piromyces finnis]|eukprot:ORX47315.1 hypothetical protein BCR36DRAFT_295772 [Piromyces finnis]